MAAKVNLKVSRGKIAKFYTIYVVKDGKAIEVASRVPAGLKIQVLSEIPRSFAR